MSDPLTPEEVERMRARDREWSAMTPTDFLPTWSRERLADAYFLACLDRKWLLLTLDAARVAPSDGLRERIGDIEPKLTHEGIVWVPYDAVLAALATTGQPEHESWCYRRHVGDCVDGPAQPEDTRTADPGGLRARMQAAVRESERRGYATVVVARDDLAALVQPADPGGLRVNPMAENDEEVPGLLRADGTRATIRDLRAALATTGQREGLDAELERVLSDAADLGVVGARALLAHLRATVEGT
jgi:hypothetical protein